jgi:hypothetical protein
MYNITEEELISLQNIANEMPTKFGVHVLEVVRKVASRKEKEKENDEDQRNTGD